jgi:hypothetical protein
MKGLLEILKALFEGEGVGLCEGFAVGVSARGQLRRMLLCDNLR